MPSNATTTAVVRGSCITTTPGPYDYVPIYDCRALFSYDPSFGAAVFFAVLFGLSTILHIIQARIFRKRFCWVIIMAGLWETAGFSIRAAATRSQLQLGFFLPEELLIMLAPLWVNAFIYMLVGRMVNYYLPEKNVYGFPARKMAVVFVCMDIISFIVQGTGGTIASGSESQSDPIVMIGLHVYMGGVGLQQLFILLFSILIVKFHRRLLNLERSVGLGEKSNWLPLLYATYACLVFITIRIIFRLVQYSSGVLSYIPTHEAFFYVFEALPMSLALWLVNGIHPGRYLVGPDSEFPPKAKGSGWWWRWCCGFCCCCCGRRRGKGRDDYVGNRSRY
jgi:hypothetical protein